MPSEPILQTYDQVFRHYNLIARQLLGQSKHPLKTDCFNESIDRPIILDGLAKLIEYDQQTITIATNKNPSLDVVKGDIRHLPFKDKEFDLILDLSTIDHIAPDDLEETLDGYARVLEKGGQLLLISWLSEEAVNPIDWNPGFQYHHRYNYLKQLISDRFTIDGETNLFVRPDRSDGCYLYEFVCHK
jgi:SAM-dependent methyltransferase